MNKFPDKTNHVTHYLLSKFLGNDRHRQMNKKGLRSDCCNAQVIIVGREGYKCIKCGVLGRSKTDYERMSFMSKSIS